MPTVPVLTDGLASAFNFEPSKAKSLSRYLREADMLTSGARGVNAPQATNLDASRLILVMMLNSTLPFVVDDLRIVGTFVPLRPDQLLPNFAPATLEDGLAWLIGYAGNMARKHGSTVERIEFRLRPHVGLADITIAHPKRKKVTLSFGHPDLLGWDGSGDLPDSYLAIYKRFPTGFYQEPMMTERELITVGTMVLGADQ